MHFSRTHISVRNNVAFTRFAVFGREQHGACGIVDADDFGGEPEVERELAPRDKGDHGTMWSGRPVTGPVGGRNAHGHTRQVLLTAVVHQQLLSLYAAG